MWATTKSNRWLFHAVYELNGEPTAVCNRRVKPVFDIDGYEGTSTREEIELAATVPTIVVGSADGAKRRKNYSICPRCAAKGSAPDLRRPAESHAGAPAEESPTVAALIEAGYDRAAYRLSALAEVVTAWLADDVDVWSVDGMLALIASKHRIGA